MESRLHGGVRRQEQVRPGMAFVVQAPLCRDKEILSSVEVLGTFWGLQRPSHVSPFVYRALLPGSPFGSLLGKLLRYKGS